MNPETHQNAETTLEEPRRFSMLVSLLFWLTLIVSASLYSAVALSPKLLSYIELRNQHFQNQVVLVDLEDQVQHLERVATALESDPEFADELARVEFDASRPGDQRVAVQQTLWLDRPDSLSSPVAEAHTLPWYTPLIRAFAGNQELRNYSLAAAAILILMAFTFLHESQEPQIRSIFATIHAGISVVVRRYRSHS